MPKKTIHSENRAIIVLEKPWELDQTDSNRTSVLPFIEGMAKFAGNTEVYHANFYDKKHSKWLLTAFAKRDFKTPLYIWLLMGVKEKLVTLI